MLYYSLFYGIALRSHLVIFICLSRTGPCKSQDKDDFGITMQLCPVFCLLLPREANPKSLLVCLCFTVYIGTDNCIK